MEEAADELDCIEESDQSTDRKQPYSAPLPDSLNKHFTFDNTPVSRSLEDSSESQSDDYQVPNTWLTENRSPPDTTEDGYMSMGSPNPCLKTDTGQFIQTYTITGHRPANAVNSVPGTGYATIVGCTSHVSYDISGDTGDYMNAPRKPARSVFEPFGSVKKLNAENTRSCFGSVNPVTGKGEVSSLQNNTVVNASAEQFDTENVYVAPEFVREPDYQNFPENKERSDGDYENMKSYTDSVFPEEDNIYKVPSQKYAGFPKPLQNSRLARGTRDIEGHKALEKSVSDPEINMRDNDYQVPPAPRRLRTIDLHDDDFYQVPPTARCLTHVNPSPPRGDNVNALVGKIRESRMDDAGVYDKPPAPVHITIQKKPVKENGALGKVKPPVAAKRMTAQNIKTTTVSKNESEEIQEKREEFYKLNTDQVVDCLNYCCLTKLAKVCGEKKLNGEHFRTITADELKEEPFEMNWFYISKFFKVIDGWRPKLR